LKQVITAAGLMGVGLVNTFCGGDAKKTVDENWADAEKLWPSIIAHAKDKGVRLAFENCPMIFSDDEWPGGHNIAYSPRIWRRILETWGGDIGINYDPSHLVWQMIDQARFIREFGKYMYHVHAKDLMIDRDGLYERGIMSEGIGWQIPRMPGLGEVNWSAFFSGLYQVGYDGPVIIEHEDRRFEGSDDKVKQGFLLARDVLKPFVR
jgi:sugar phosphate isomerase/epimerase